MESAFGKIAELFIGSGGLIGALFILACIVIVFLWREVRAEDKSRSDLYERRIDEAKVIASALQSNTATLTTLTNSVDARSELLSGLVQAVQAMASENQASRGEFRMAVDRVERALADIRGHQT